MADIDAKKIEECEMTEAFSYIQAERIRQMEVEGWSAEHDDTHSSGEMLSAAVIYLWWGTDKAATLDANTGTPLGWPWDAKWWKPKTRFANLVRSGALCMADAARRRRAGLSTDPADHKLRIAIRELSSLLDLAERASLPLAGDVDALCKALLSYQQADADGVMVTVSRQACDEAASLIRSLAGRVEAEKRATREECALIAEQVINKMRGSGQSDLRTVRHRTVEAILAGGKANG